MNKPKINLQEQTPCKKKLQLGDIFTLKYGDNRYFFGRIMRINFVFAAIPAYTQAILVYIYAGEYKNVDAIPDMRPSNLLIPPEVINRLGFSRGYMVVVNNVKPEPPDYLDVHCFRDSFFGKYRDLDGNELSHPFAMMGNYGLGSYLTIDMEISRKIGLQSPETYPENKGR